MVLVAGLAAGWLAGEGIGGAQEAFGLEAEGRYRLLGEGALRVHSPVEPTRMRARTEVELRLRQGFTWRGTLGIRAFRDWALDRSRYSDRARELEGSEVELSELTLGVAIGRLDLVAGRRQVAWGALIGQFVSDRVMPFDLRDFLLPDPDQIRRPLWMVEALVTGEPVSAEAIVVLERRRDLLPPPGSEFALAASPGGAGDGEDGAVDRDRLDPSRVALADAEPGLRLIGSAGGVDVSGYVLASHPDIDPLATHGELGERDLVLGMTGASAVGAYALRAEAAIERDRPLVGGENADGTAEPPTEDVVRYGVVVDRALPRAQMVSFQGVHESAALGLGGEGRSEAALRWSSDPSGRPWTTSVEFHQGLDGDWLLRPRVAYSLGSSWLVESGVDWFGGRGDTYYGQFDDRDRITLAITRAGRWASGDDGSSR